jgi:hypothetical protein
MPILDTSTSSVEYVEGQCPELLRGKIPLLLVGRPCYQAMKSGGGRWSPFSYRVASARPEEGCEREWMSRAMLPSLSQSGRAMPYSYRMNDEIIDLRH